MSVARPYPVHVTRRPISYPTASISQVVNKIVSLLAIQWLTVTAYRRLIGILLLRDVELLTVKMCPAADRTFSGPDVLPCHFTYSSNEEK